MRHKKTRRPSPAQLAVIGKIDAECRRLGAKGCKRPDGIADRTWWKCYKLGYIETVGRDGDTPLVGVGSHGRVWLSSCPKPVAAVIKLPPKFWLDHAERDLPTPEDVGNAKSYVLVRADDPALPELLNDAEFYADPFGPDAEWLGGLKASARATIRAIRDVIGWDDASDTVKRLRRPQKA